jgi:hypothetical protein
MTAAALASPARARKLEKPPEDLPADSHMGRLTALLALVSCLGGCGLAGSGAAATAGAASEAQQAAQATQAEARVKQQIDASYQQATERRRAGEADAQ